MLVGGRIRAAVQVSGWGHDNRPASAAVSSATARHCMTEGHRASKTLHRATSLRLGCDTTRECQPQHRLEHIVACEWGSSTNSQPRRCVPGPESAPISLLAEDGGDEDRRCARNCARRSRAFRAGGCRACSGASSARESTSFTSAPSASIASKDSPFVVRNASRCRACRDPSSHCPTSPGGLTLSVTSSRRAAGFAASRWSITACGNRQGSPKGRARLGRRQRSRPDRPPIRASVGPCQALDVDRTMGAVPCSSAGRRR